MKTIAITGGKGGTGKSTIATAIASYLSKGCDVLLADADVDCPNDHLLLGIARKKVKTVEQRIPEFEPGLCNACGRCAKACVTNSIAAVSGKKPLFFPQQCNGCGACRLSCPSGAISWARKEIGAIYEGRLGRLHLILGELKENEPVSELVVKGLNKEIGLLKEKFSYIIIDTAAGTHCPVIAAILGADKVIAVTEPTPLGAHDLEIMIQLLGKIGKEASIILNRSDIGDAGLIRKISSRYGAKIIMEVPFSKSIADSYANANPVVIEGLKAMIEEFL